MFFDVQIKARSKESKAGQVGHFPLLDCQNELYIHLLLRGAGERGQYWVNPSMTIVKPGFGNYLKSGKNKGKYRLICVFRSMPATSSGPCRAMIPVHVGPPFRSMPAGGCDAG